MGNLLLPKTLLGFPCIRGFTGIGNLSLNTSGTWLAIGFVAPTSKTVNKIRFFVNTITGSLGVNDVTCDIYSDSAGQPGSSLASSNTLSATIAAGSWANWTGLNLALTEGTMYWVVFKNVNGTPASNSPNLRFMNTANFVMSSSSALWSYLSATTTNSGSIWTKNTGALPNFRLDYADGTFDGAPFSNITTDSTNTVNGSNEWGAVFTNLGASVNVHSAFMQTCLNGTPSQGLVYKLYNGTTLLGTSETIPVSNISGVISALIAKFPTPVTLPAGATIRLTMAEAAANSDTSSNRYNNEYLVWDSDSNSQGLKPFGGTLSQTYSNNGGVSFTDDSTKIPAFGLFLAPGSEINVVTANAWIN